MAKQKKVVGSNVSGREVVEKRSPNAARSIGLWCYLYRCSARPVYVIIGFSLWPCQFITPLADTMLMMIVGMLQLQLPHVASSYTVWTKRTMIRSLIRESPQCESENQNKWWYKTLNADNNNNWSLTESINRETPIGTGWLYAPLSRKSYKDIPPAERPSLNQYFCNGTLQLIES